MSSTTRLGLPLLAAAQAQKHVTHNEALLALDAIVQLSVVDRDLSAPPPSPGEGDAYIVGPSATGFWTGRTGQVAAFQDGIWRFYPAQHGWIAYVVDEDTCVTWTGTAWRAFGLSPSEILARLSTVDGAGSGMDADLLDGQQGSYYADVSARLGYTPANQAGETFTGAVSVQGNITAGSNTASAAAVILNAAEAMHRYIDWQRAGSRRYYFGVNTAETGGNAGSNMVLEAYSDAGASLGAVWSVIRATRQMTIPNVNVTGGSITGLAVLSTNQSITIGSTTNPGTVLGFQGAAGTERYISFRSGSVMRFYTGLSASAETGANSGSDFYLSATDDSGNWIGDVYRVNRATRAMTIPNINAVGGSIANTRIQLPSYTVATLPSAAIAGQMAYVSNGTANKRLATADGTSWRFADGAIVS